MSDLEATLRQIMQLRTPHGAPDIDAVRLASNPAVIARWISGGDGPLFDLVGRVPTVSEVGQWHRCQATGQYMPSNDAPCPSSG